MRLHLIFDLVNFQIDALEVDELVYMIFQDCSPVGVVWQLNSNYMC